jgi:hypothetical protein
MLGMRLKYFVWSVTKGRAKLFVMVRAFDYLLLLFLDLQTCVANMNELRFCSFAEKQRIVSVGMVTFYEK